MTAYILRRIALIVPTMLGIMLLTFVMVQFAPGGPVEQLIAKLTGTDPGATAMFSGGGGDFAGKPGQGGIPGRRVGAVEISRRARARPRIHRDAWRSNSASTSRPMSASAMMMWNYLRFDFGQSYFRDTSVLNLISEKLPVSISLGLWMTLLSYAISIPLGIRKAVRDGSRFDVSTSAVIIIAYAIPGFLFAVFMIVLFAGGSFLQIFPLRGLVSENWSELPWYLKITDYFWHITLPLIAMALSAFATTTFLTKNSFLEEIRKQYVMTAQAKGLTEHQVLYGHVFRNAMLIVIAGFPGAFIGAFFAGSLLIETIFSLEGLGLLSFESLVNRDYPVVFATVYIFSLMGLAINLLSDLIYMWVDPRIDFETREV